MACPNLVNRILLLTNVRRIRRFLTHSRLQGSYPETAFREMTDETCGRVVARPNIIAVLDLPGRHFAAGRLSLNSTAMLKMPPRFNSEIVSKGVGSIQEARPQKLSQNRGSLHWLN